MSARSRRSGFSSDRSPSNRPPRRPREPGQQAGAGDLKLRSYQVGALPLVNHLLERMRLREILAERGRLRSAERTASVELPRVPSTCVPSQRSGCSLRSGLPISSRATAMP